MIILLVFVVMLNANCTIPCTLEIKASWVIQKGCFELLSNKFEALGRGKKPKVSGVVWWQFFGIFGWSVIETFEVYQVAGVDESWDLVRYWAALY